MRRPVSVGLMALAAALVSTTIGLSSGPANAATSSSTPIVVGGDSSLALDPGLSQGFEAGIYRFNKGGGLDGRKITFVGTLDDGFSGQTNLTNAQRLVENEHVMVVAPVATDGGTDATGTFLAQHQVPFIGYETNPMFLAVPKWGWGIDGDQVTGSIQTLGWRNILKLTGNTKTPSKVKIALIGNDYATAVAGVKELSDLSTYVGMKVVYSGTPIPVIGVTNFQPYAQAIISSGANVVFTLTEQADAVGVSAALKSAGWKGTFFSPTGYDPGDGGVTPDAVAAVNGTYATSQFPVDANTPAARQAEKDLKSIGQPPYLTEGVSIGYWSAIFLEQLLRATLKRVGNNPNLVNSVALEKTVNSGHWAYTDPLPGGIGTEYFPAAETIPTACSAYTKVEGSSYKVVIPYSCTSIVDLTTKKIVNQKTGVG